MNKDKLQNWFNESFKGLKAQGFMRSVDPVLNVNCKMRGDNGAKCALGHLITDGEYEQTGESPRNVRNFLLGDKNADPEATKAERDFLIELMGCHDGGHTPGIMLYLLKKLAEKYDLTVPQ